MLPSIVDTSSSIDVVRDVAIPVLIVEDSPLTVEASCATYVIKDDMVDEASPVPVPLPVPSCPMAVENVDMVEVTFWYVIISLLTLASKFEDSPLTVEASCATYVTKDDMVDEASPVPVPVPVPTCPMAVEKDDMASYINEENGLVNDETVVLNDEFKFIRLPKNVDIDDDELPSPPVLNGKAIPLIEDTVKLDVLNVYD